jgi:hypothetical protein
MATMRILTAFPQEATKDRFRKNCQPLRCQINNIRYIVKYILTLEKIYTPLDNGGSIYGSESLVD